MEMIKDFTDGEHVFTQLLVTAVNKCVTTQGRTYLNITLQDSSGTIAAKKWDVFEGDYDVFVEGNVVSVEGEVLKYQNALQFKIISGMVVPVSSVDVTKFIQQAPEAREELEKELNGYLDSLAEGELKTMTKYLINKFHDAYVIHPAAVRNHHNFCSGLLYHSICMARVAEQICKIYPHLNRDWVVAGALIHDLGKTIELSGALCTKYTVEGNLVGHISIMVAEIRMAAKELGIEGETLTLLEHMILSHHTKPEYGSPVAPMTREALALAMIDDFDAKMNVVDKALENADIGGFTDKIFALDSRGYYVPSYEKKNRE
ncbi:MAG: HD domain-containing protein [Bacilli bacterium]|nr:HD domain-containing protein [Bacilli bacterium]